MCYASDYAIGTILKQRKIKLFQPIYYASKTFKSAQENYTTTGKELLPVVFAFDKFRPCFILYRVTVFIDHLAFCYLMSKANAKLRLI